MAFDPPLGTHLIHALVVMHKNLHQVPRALKIE
jgi:hypothetical protein